MFRNVHIWLGSYLRYRYLKQKEGWNAYSNPYHILFTICDHFEPYWNKVDDHTAYNRVKSWLDHYQPIAENHKDCLGSHPKHCFFYPIEEYKKSLIEMVGEICRNGFGETEIHLHHDNDNPENLRRTLLEYKNVLAEKHGLLPRNRFSSETQYGFIHGNWALDNSRPDGKWCGVNNEITILQETGCYADFTMPSAPDITQTKTINSIYYAVDNPNKPKSHNTGKPAVAGITGQKGLLCIQGPLCLNIHSRKFGILPRIENGCLSSDMPMSPERINLWVGQHIHVQGRPDIIFVKLYTHGTQEKTMRFFFDDGMLDYLFSQLEFFCTSQKYRLHYVSSRQMYNVVKGLEMYPDASPEQLLEHELELNYS